MDRNIVLVLSNANDPHTDAVVNELKELDVEVVRWHPDEFHSDSVVDLSSLTQEVRIRSSGRSCRPEAVRSCWYRRPRLPQPVLWRIPKSQDELVAQETSAVISGFYELLDCIWYSHPEALRRAGSKISQLQQAKRLGFEVPEYCISNQGDVLREFLRHHEKPIVKAINERSASVQDGANELVFRVRRLGAAELEKDLQDWSHGPLYLQRYVEKKFDVRLTVVGSELFACAIHQPVGDAPVEDWRGRVWELPHEIINCPDDIRRNVHAYMCAFGLNYGAFDFVVDHEDRWWFLECNPNGQWLWIELATGAKIARALARSLALDVEPLVCSVIQGDRSAGRLSYGEDAQ